MLDLWYFYVGGNVKVRYYFDMTGKYRDCNINDKFNHQIPFVFLKLKKLWFASYYARTKQVYTKPI